MGPLTKFQQCTRFAMLLRECDEPRQLACGRHLHAQILNGDLGGETFLSNLLIQMYGTCGSLQDAKQVFDGIQRPNIFSYTIMITALVQAGQRRRALELYHRVDLEGLAPDEATLVIAIAACESLSQGKAIHQRLQARGKMNLISANSLLGLYGRLGSIEGAACLFHSMLERDAVSWTSLLSAYAQNGHSRTALDLYKQGANVEENEVTYIVLLGACGELGDLARGMELHARIVSRMSSWVDSSNAVVLANAMVTMLARCGSLPRARKFFDRIAAAKTRVSWTAMLAAYVQQGLVSSAKEVFHAMAVEGESPDEVTFVSLLHACSHGGELEEAAQYFGSMVSDYDLSQSNEHCRRCLLDLLGRVGWLDEAERLLAEEKTLGSSVVAWKTFLGACKTHSSARQAQCSSLNLRKLQPGDATSYVMLSNLYAHKSQNT
ncbi:putative pentatricopeptide repeat-containing protein At1g56570 [Selaginella moellendorffii]|uniref:putative pentatricopeptide repeat-containing protein At1g56570 n=1 Tax=Selaginella moellendorffii TaxID=88036 RepID=UPI000D1D02D1|nr:putative pentatricopeptide repeat-containing protein At1g56570 [Selaginella moellendorffii]|eukprot:XP_024529681.1 putative pentatricopeptide repeat-containing protein At1g56570 [Selaginella moellendorffii]